MAPYEVLPHSEIKTHIEEELCYLGRGCFGVALKVKYDDGYLGQEACLKVGCYHDDLELYQWEAEILNTVKGIAGCPRVLAAASDAPMIVMTFVPGTRVNDLVDDGDLTPAKWMKVFLSIASALQEIHALGFTHCDVKGDNIRRAGTWMCG